MACSVVCVSHTTGSGGHEVGKQIAERLGYLFVDEDIVASAAAAGGLEPKDIFKPGTYRCAGALRAAADERTAPVENSCGVLYRRASPLYGPSGRRSFRESSHCSRVELP